jgi:branched-chain amino acid transport system substrate-binding protein
MKRMLLIFSGIAIVAALFGTGCATAQKTKQETTLKIGVILPLSGKYAPYGKKVFEGIKLASEEVNANRKNGAPKVWLAFFDNKSTPAGTVSAMKKLAGNVSVVIGAYSTSNSLSLKPLALKYKLPIITPTATNDIVTERNPYMFRSCFNDSSQAAAMAYFMYHDKDLHRIGIMINIQENGTYSRDLGRTAEEKFRKYGGKVLNTVGFYSGTHNFEAPLKSLIKSKCRAVFAPSYPVDAASIILQARNLKYNKPLFGSDGWDEPQVLENCGNNPGPCFFSSMFSLQYQKPEVKKFVDAIRRKTGETPGMCEAQGYDTLKLAVKAASLRNGGADLRGGLYRIKNYPGVTGNISIDASGNAVKPVFVKKIVKTPEGKLITRLVKILNPEQINRIVKK